MHCEELHDHVDSEVPFSSDKIFTDRYDLLGHIIHGHVSGTFIDFKTTKTPAPLVQ